ncbi:hypothetical protein ISF_03839 [Cordyceps fumosorosea ARSEF 2679]|uniref:Uncharacterized protein n=1 Tax=Cordyceps fumosorosea (strain ARSEF 2679) TaxID=1081104 RepID=A0A167ZLL9_CORFA|nr:hypothetical protein ISF_03839 [Cordyceps fumosorosea ARSEF 2679]OAA67663.1 hypothetical protein ISF_03839 [Cordyceps fumosorosea ARSEF 2679]
MTNHPRGPSLLQARDSYSVDPSPSFASDSHTRFAVHLQNHRHAHYPHAHHHTRQQDASNNDHGDTEDQQPPLPAAELPPLEPAVAQFHLDDGAASDTLSLEARSLAAAVDAALAVRAQDDAPYVTQVVQTISIVQVVDASGSPISSSTEYATPNTVVVDRSTGETMSQSSPAFSIAINPSSLLPGLGSGSSSTPSTTSSTYHTTSTSSQPASAPSPSSSVSSFPTLSDTSNGTTWGNTTMIITPTNSTARPVSLTQSPKYNISTTPSDFRIFTSSSSSDTDTTSSSSYSSTRSSTPTWNSPTTIPTVAGSAETTSASTSGGDTLTTQQKQIVGGVVGSVAGVAFLALLVMLALRYKKKQGSESLPSSTETQGIPALRAPGNASANPMAERNAAASSINATFAAMTGKRQLRGNAAAASDTPEVPSGGERGFYRVSGRKLPSVLHTGGDGYTDPRQSTMSQYSQSSEPFNRGDEPFALGSPMRPVSGVPIMRSGPARTPVTEANPFADPMPSPPPPNNASPPRRPGSSGSARGSSSRFQESI